MTKEQVLLLELLAHSITGCEIQCDTSHIDWMALIKESISQTVSVLAFDSVTPIKENIPDEIYKQWFNHSYGSIAVNSLVEKSQKELVEILTSGGYDYIILKGLSAANYYEKPELRALGDVDFLIDPDKKNEIKELLVKNGYTASHEEHICHIVFTKPKAHLEMHFKISGMPKGDIGEKVRAFMSKAQSNPQILTVGGNTFNAPKEKYHAVILLLHMQHHILGEGIGLRHLQDWAFFVNKTYKEPFWERELIPFLKETGLHRFMNTITDICVRYLKIPSPKWLEATDNELCNEIIEDILSGGNFGKKDKNRSTTAMSFANKSKKGKIKTAFKTLKTSTVDLYPIAKKHKLLLPFIYFYRIVKYAFLVCIGKKTSLKKSVPVAEKRADLYNKLRIFEKK